MPFLTPSRSSSDIEELGELAKQLGFGVTNPKDAQDLALLLKSFKGVVQGISDGPDYIPPALEPQPTIDGPRTFWKPEPKDNPFNAWSYRCSLASFNPATDILRGRTIAIKDNISVGGLPTTLGTVPELHADGTFPISSIDATVVSRLLSAGAVIKGTSTCESFCASPLSFTSATGPVHHPLLYGYTSGGSSSGSCALVAAQKIGDPSVGETCELAIGSDQAGSVRIPACYTGLYGLKPTHGLVPYTGAASMCAMIDHLGPIATSLEDIAALLKVMAGYDGLDARMTPESPLVGHVKDYPAMLSRFRQSISDRSATKLMRLGILKEAFEIAGLSPDVRDMVRDSAVTCFSAAGAELVEVSVPMHLEGPSIWTASTRHSMSEWLCEGRPSGYLSYLAPHIKPVWPPTQKTYELLASTNPAVINIIFSGKLAHEKLSPGEEGKAHRRIFELRAAYDKALAEVDVLITPCAPTIAKPHPDPSEKDIMERLKAAVGVTNNTCPFNVTGHPAMNVPCGELPVPGVEGVKLPVGMQVIGKRWNDEGVLMAAALFEEGQRLVQK